MRDHTAYQSLVQATASVWGCINAHETASLKIWQNTKNAEIQIQVWEKQMLPARGHLFPCIFQWDSAKHHTTANVVCYSFAHKLHCFLLLHSFISLPEVQQLVFLVCKCLQTVHRRHGLVPTCSRVVVKFKIHLEFLKMRTGCRGHFEPLQHQQ